MEGDSVMARPMATIFFWPPDRKRPRRWVKFAISGKRARTRASMSSPRAAPRPPLAARPSDWLIWKFSATVRSGKIPASSGE